MTAVHEEREPIVRISDAAVVLGGRTVWSQVGFDVQPGEFLGLIGTNGTGKTTLLRAILGTVPLAEGSIQVLGHARGRGHDLGYVPQKVVVDPDLPLRARDVVALGLDGAKVGLPLRTRSTWERVERALGAVDAQDLSERRIGRLSGGQQQRVLLAQSLVSDPKLVLLDEPLANLDPASVQEIVALLGRISRERNMAVILTAHDMNPLLPVLDRIVYLAKGHAAVGTTQEVARTDVLTRLYGSPIEVVTVHGRVVILPASGAPDTEAVHHSEPVQREPLP